MQCRRAIAKSTCSAKNAYSPAVALRSAFATDTAPPKPDGSRPTTTTTQDASNTEPVIPDTTPGDVPKVIHTPNYYTTTGWRNHIGRVKRVVQAVVEAQRWSPNYKTSAQRKAIIDYRPSIIHPPRAVSHLSNVQRKPIWLGKQSHPERIKLPASQVLEREIKNFAEYIQPTDTERIARRGVIKDINVLLDEVCSDERFNEPKYGHLTYELFGSETTGLAFPLSDIDIRLLYSEPDAKPMHTMDALRDLKERLEASDAWTNVTMVESNYPLVNATHKKSGIDAQVVATKPADRQQQVTRELLSQIPNIRELFLVIRTLFDVRNLNDVFNGGVGSYCIFIMLAASLSRPDPQGNNTSSAQLVRFLRFYRDHVPSDRGVRVAPQPFFRKHDPSPDITSYTRAATRRGDLVRAGQWLIGQRRDYVPYLLCLQDPADPRNDLARKSYAIKHIVETFRWVEEKLRGLMTAVDAALDEKLPPRVASERYLERLRGQSLLLPLVGGCHSIYAERRKQLEEFGRSLIWESNPNLDHAKRKDGEEEEEEKTPELFEAMEKADGAMQPGYERVENPFASKPDRVKRAAATITTAEQEFHEATTIFPHTAQPERVENPFLLKDIDERVLQASVPLQYHPASDHHFSTSTVRGSQKSIRQVRSRRPPSPLQNHIQNARESARDRHFALSPDLDSTVVRTHPTHKPDFSESDRNGGPIGTYTTKKLVIGNRS